MKLVSVQIKEFKSVWDSNEFEVDDLTCLVGKNEAGKTTILQALYRLNPIVVGDAVFDVVDDYPRMEVEDYRQDVESNQRKAAVVVRAKFALETDELGQLEQDLGASVLAEDTLELSRGYSTSSTKRIGPLTHSFRVSEKTVVANLAERFEIPSKLRKDLLRASNLEELAKFLDVEATNASAAMVQAQTAAMTIADESKKASELEKAKGLGETEQAKALRARISEIVSAGGLKTYVWEKFLKAHVPKFLYFDDYYQLRGHDNVQALQGRLQADNLQPSDHPLLGLLQLARLDLSDLLSVQRTQALKNKLQAASNHLSKKVLRYWSQNRHLQMQFDLRAALPGDPDGMRSGMNIWGEVYDTKRMVSTSLGSRSAGFVWFFSFLAWYSSLRKSDPIVLLLDEPGLTLHGRAQEDLLRFFEEEILTNPKHQLVYTTHSPFMVDPKHFERVRIVQDASIDTDEFLAREEDGTKVLTQVLEAGPDSLFPLQGALGYEIHQTLFVGPNCLIVEGVSDLLYLQTMSGVLAAAGRESLDERWTITPVGGSDKVPTFVALMGAQSKLRLATLIDFQKKDQQTIENLYKRKLLQKSNVLTYADFTDANEADVEDMFSERLYLELVNDEYASAISNKITPKQLSYKSPRIVVRLEQLLATKPFAGVSLNHYRPARKFAETAADREIDENTLARFETAFRRLNRLL